ncbi:hypothetical protein SETIT_3G347800v2 [Setaria italica]|uniref:Uncharacterized protein n=1 Tax=Setaria italica TaxID=4555 RepID=A0A368QM14_SETIT|nr:coiled-coil domain-containing protein 110-like [Setaria italica]RCV18991.1 hypothetical protein SETIT_3G347800v2 [Setaria italica]
MGNNTSTDPSIAKSKEVFQVRNDLQEELEVMKKELMNQLVAATKKELQEHLKATKGELKKQSEATKKELSNQLVTATKKELQENLEASKEELKKQSEKVMKDLKEVLEYKLENKQLERKNIELSSEKAELEKQLEYTKKAALVLIDAADAYQEATEKQIKAKIEELEDTTKAALVFMEAADTYQEETERKSKARTEELENTRKAALVFMDAADTYQEAAEKQIKSKVEELEDMRMVFVDAADTYQEAAGKQINATVQTLEVLGGQEAMRVESLESEFNATLANNQEMEVDATVKKRECDLVKGENDMLQSEVLATEPKPKLNLFEAAVETQRLKMELGALVEAKEAAENAFEADMEDVMKEPKDLKSKVEKIKTIRGFVMHENETLWLEDSIVAQKYDIYEVEVESTEMQLNVLMEAKEAAAMGFNVNEAKNKKELEEIHAIRYER